MKFFSHNKNSNTRAKRSNIPRRQKFKRAKQSKRFDRAKTNQPRRGSYKRRYAFIFSSIKVLRENLGTILTLVAIASLIVVLRLIFSTNYFDVKEIRVVGIEKTDKALFEDIAKEYKGKNIYSVDLDKLEKDVEGISIYIKDVYAKKYLPDRIEITIKERYPSYTILNYDGVYLVDEEFVVTNIPVSQEIGFRQEELDTYAKNDFNSEVIKERQLSKIKSGEFDLKLDDVLKEGVELEEGEDPQIEDVDFKKVPEKLKLDELQKLKTEIDAIISEHFKSLEQTVNESEYAGLRRVYFMKNAGREEDAYKEGQIVEKSRLQIYNSVYEYFADSEEYSIAKSTWVTDYTLQINFVEKKAILFGTNRGIDQQLEDLKVVLEELRIAGKNFKRIDLRTETIGVK